LLLLYYFPGVMQQDIFLLSRSFYLLSNSQFFKTKSSSRSHVNNLILLRERRDVYPCKAFLNDFAYRGIESILQDDTKVDTIFKYVHSLDPCNFICF
jgi:hypothetical protein